MVIIGIENNSNLLQTHKMYVQTILKQTHHLSPTVCIILFCSPLPVKNKCSQLVVFRFVTLPSFLPNRDSGIKMKIKYNKSKHVIEQEQVDKM